MDALVAKYRRPAGAMQETFTEDDERELMGLENPGLSLKFAMPPVTHVSIETSSPRRTLAAAILCSAQGD
jgi:hypothetical protein